MPVIYLVSIFILGSAWAHIPHKLQLQINLKSYLFVKVLEVVPKKNAISRVGEPGGELPSPDELKWTWYIFGDLYGMILIQKKAVYLKVSVNDYHVFKRTQLWPEVSTPEFTILSEVPLRENCQMAKTFRYHLENIEVTSEGDLDVTLRLWCDGLRGSNPSISEAGTESETGSSIMEKYDRSKKPFLATESEHAEYDPLGATQNLRLTPGGPHGTSVLV